MENKTTSEVFVSQPRSKFCKIHRFDNHDTEKCTDVRATINKMVENRCRPTGEVRWDSLLSHDPRAIPIKRDEVEERETDVPASRAPHQTNQGQPNKQPPAVQPII
ncbi:hypothetical protein Adt_03639 [Abeliophyllum distichum]|uniref:Uncharacterized protein n=1 Tax=Abeliophyllum distichum TaxID=126358 RepID=A0ABD1VZJ4_9LAMI